MSYQADAALPSPRTPWQLSGVATVRQDASGFMTDANEAALAALGGSRPSLLGRRVALLLSPENPSQHETQDQALRERPAGLSTPVRYFAHSVKPSAEQDAKDANDGCPGDVVIKLGRDLLVLKVLLDPAHPLESDILTSWTDVSDLYEAQRDMAQARDAALQASMSKNEFMANISHELRTPLQSIIGFSELGQRRARQDEMLKSMFTDVLDAGRRMLRLVNDLLDLARSDLAEMPMTFEFMDLRGLLREVVRETRLLAEAKALEVQVHMPGQPLLAGVDPYRFQQVLRNVLANAIKFSPSNERIELAAWADDMAGIWFAVADRGPGIPQAEIEKIFDAFYQSSRTKDGSGGTGLGLAISRRIMQSHGGHISAHEREGGGALFRIWMPDNRVGRTEGEDFVLDITQPFEGSDANSPPLSLSTTPRIAPYDLGQRSRRPL